MSSLDSLTIEDESEDEFIEFVEDFLEQVRDTQEQVHQYVVDDINGYKVTLAISLVSITPLPGELDG